MPAFRRTSGSRLVPRLAAGASALVLAAAALAWASTPADAQSRGMRNVFNPQSMAGARPDGESRMLVQANEIVYDNDRQVVAAVGQVQLYYQGSVLEADRVELDQRTSRLRAFGNVKFTRPDGNIIYAEVFDFTDDFREGFAETLRVETFDRTRFSGARVDRTDGNATVFLSGTYTACEPCKDNPQKPPLWQVRAARIISNQKEQMVYFEDARLEFFGVPLAYVPFMSAPDPTVRRKTGWLAPDYLFSSQLGVGVAVPFFWATAPNHDLTITPRAFSRQGFMLETEWRHRLINGAYGIRAAGIAQADPSAFVGTPGDRDNRGMISSSGRFRINPRWSWGWDGTVFSDRSFLTQYSFVPASTRQIESQLFLSGTGDYSYFDARSQYFHGLSRFDRQDELPVIHPVIDYAYRFRDPVLGGQLGFNFNFLSLSRSEADFDTARVSLGTIGRCLDPLDLGCNAVMRGAPGAYTRASAQMRWQRTIIDPIGQVWRPFFQVRGDATWRSVRGEQNVQPFVNPQDEAAYRLMPVAGVEYRYPFVAATTWGSHILEPIAQFVLRPNEVRIGSLPNEDAQSLVFDDTNLFSVNKFSGWDRIEGGGRLNAGVQYSGQLNNGLYFSALFGQSYQLFGRNSYAFADMANTGINSGLENSRSDYVARLYVQPSPMFSGTARARFDERSWEFRRFEFETRLNLQRGSLTAIYGNYDAQPEIGYLARREGILTIGTMRVTDNWSLSAGTRYNAIAGGLDQLALGVNYLDECYAFGLNYITDWTRGDAVTTVHRVMLQFSLRTLGETAISTGLDSLFGSGTPTSR